MTKRLIITEFKNELDTYGRIYMYRFRPDYKMVARPINEYPAKSKQAAGIMLMIQNNLDYTVAQHPHELITYGGNGAIFQNWAQYRLAMKYLAEMNNEQTLVMYSGHPMGLFPSHKEAPRVVVTNGMMIPNYSKPDDWEKFNALGVTQYGQMTAGSYMYIGPQGIVHGTTITVLNGFRKINKSPKGNLSVTSGLGGMSGAQPKAGNIAGCITVCAEVNPKITQVRLDQGWIDEKITDLDKLVKRVNKAKAEKETISIAYLGNIVEVWEKFDEAIKKEDIGYVILGRDHHDVSGTDSPYRETSNIYDGSSFTADMAIHNVIGDSFRGATWVSIHNGGGVGWGEVINGGFGMVLDGTIEAEKRLKSMLFWDVNNGISRRSWARNEEAIFSIKRAMEVEPNLNVTLPNIVDDSLFDSL